VLLLKAAVIDLGFNSVKMVCYNVDQQSGSFRPFRQDSFRAKLGEGLDEAGFLGAAQMQRTVDYVKILSEIAALESIDRILPIATSAVREASNGQQFVKSVFAETGLTFKVLSAADEALYSYVGAMRFASVPDVVFFDLGGGSLEVVRALGSRIRSVMSLPVGVLRLSLRYRNGKGSFSRRQSRLMKKTILHVLPRGEDLQVSRRTRLVGVGGTVRAIARRDQENSSYPFTKIQSYAIPYRAVSSISKSFLKMTKKELSNEREIGNRAETITAGTLVVKMLMKSLGVEELTVSAHGLREGALAMYLGDTKLFHASSVSTNDVERFLSESTSESKYYAEGYSLTLERAGLVDRREASLLGETLRVVTRVTPSVNLMGLFYSVLEEESEVSRHDQLMMASIVVTARNDRVAELIVRQYGHVLGRKDMEDVKRLAAFYSFIEILNGTGATLRASRHGSELWVKIIEGRARLPASLLSHNAETISEALGIRLNLTFSTTDSTLLAAGRGDRDHRL